MQSCSFIQASSFTSCCGVTYGNLRMKFFPREAYAGHCRQHIRGNYAEKELVQSTKKTGFSWIKVKEKNKTRPLPCPGASCLSLLLVALHTCDGLEHVWESLLFGQGPRPRTEFSLAASSPKLDLLFTP
ncbi:hypothetical protein AV530_011747 [Patagioenas fasciata monilis]|uniref:Uncharacterized protein n=1 Tax=Patagioenas fasciata monilis TaxID=372326 RepID=A0A1V4KLH2_PATFA|nr:hypothetical protein AV530_011747 [Patagioenas fasciata monilis]